MGEKAKIILNEYFAKDLLMKDNLDLNKFYTADLKLFVEVAIAEIKRLNKTIDNIQSQLEYLETYSSKEDVFEDMKSRLNKIENIIKERGNNDTKKL